MSTQTALHSRDRGVLAPYSGNGYVRNLVEGNLEAYMHAFGVTNLSPEDMIDTLVQEVITLLKRLENELITTSGSIPVRKKIKEDLKGPEYTLGWMKSELLGGIEGTKKRIQSSLLTERRMSIKESILRIFSAAPKTNIDTITEEDIQRALEEGKHQYNTTLTDAGKNILNGYLKSVGKDPIDTYIAQNKERLHTLIGPSRAYETE